MERLSFPSCLILIFLAVAAAPTPGRASECPLNISRTIDQNRNMVNQCCNVTSFPNASLKNASSPVFRCCVGIQEIVRMLTFAWLHSTRRFMLPNLSTAEACMADFTRELFARRVPLANVTLERCGIKTSDFVMDKSMCHGITDLDDFLGAVDITAMNNKCKSVWFNCGDCLRSMAATLQVLDPRPTRLANSSCSDFIMMYVAAGLNDYRTLSMDKLTCMLSTPSLDSIALNLGRGSDDTVKGSRRLLMLILVPVCAAAVTLIATVVVWKGLNGRRARRVKETMRSYQLLSESTGLSLYPLRELQLCTDNFSESRVVGEGGSGVVFVGRLMDGSHVAVKRFKTGGTATRRASNYAELFSHEMHVISGVKHRNLLPLRGFCLDVDGATGSIRERILVYDYMPAGSLADNLFQPRRLNRVLKWAERYRIAVGIARGLAYLHEHVKPAIIHRDVKAANVMLDESLEPRVVDFGLAQLKRDRDHDGEEESLRSSRHPPERTVGTLGYLAPEYALYGHISEKSDVFSFGIVVLELVTGRRALDSTSGVLEHFLVSDWVVDMAHNNRMEEVVDVEVRSEYTKDQSVKASVERVLLLGLQCAHPRPRSRPTMCEALVILEAMDRPDFSQKMEYFLESDRRNIEASCLSRGDLTWHLDRFPAAQCGSLHSQEDENDLSISIELAPPSTRM